LTTLGKESIRVLDPSNLISLPVIQNEREGSSSEACLLDDSKFEIV
jgi:hypothetical protein